MEEGFEVMPDVDRSQDRPLPRMTAFMPIWVMWLLACLTFGLRGLLPGYSSYNLALDPFTAPLPPPTVSISGCTICLPPASSSTRP